MSNQTYTVRGVKLRLVKSGDTITPEDNNNRVEALKQIKNIIKSKIQLLGYSLPSEIENKIEGLRIVGYGDEVRSTDITDTKQAILDLIDFLNSLGFSNRYLDNARSYINQIPDLKAGDIIFEMHHNYLVEAIRNLSEGIEYITTGIIEEPELSNGGSYIEYKLSILFEEPEGLHGGSFIEYKFSIILEEPELSNGGGYIEYPGRSFLEEPEGPNGGSYLKMVGIKVEEPEGINGGGYIVYQ